MGKRGGMCVFVMMIMICVWDIRKVFRFVCCMSVCTFFGKKERKKNEMREIHTLSFPLIRVHGSSG